MSLDIATIRTLLDTNKAKYLDLTHQLNNYNEIYNVNFYLNNMNSLEEERLRTTNENIKAKILKMKQEYMLMDYGVHENKMRSRIMYTTIIVSSVIFILFTMFYTDKFELSQGTVVMASCAILVVYFLLVLFILKANAKRRKYAWDQYYWQAMKKNS